MHVYVYVCACFFFISGVLCSVCCSVFRRSCFFSAGHVSQREEQPGVLHILVCVFLGSRSWLEQMMARGRRMQSLTTRPRGVYRRAELRVYGFLRRGAQELFGLLIGFTHGVTRRVM